MKRHNGEHEALMRDLVSRLQSLPGIGPRAVVALAAFGADEAVIAAAVGVKKSDLSDLFASELELGRTIAAANLVDLLWRKATAGSLGAIRELQRQMGV